MQGILFDVRYNWIKLSFGVCNPLDFIIECTLVVNYLGFVYEKLHS